MDLPMSYESKNDVFIKVENITKTYKLYDKPLNRLKELILHRPYHKEVAALNGINFTVDKGEIFGIIGDNGAGKSTLLKILSRTLTPTHGQFEVSGMVSSLLELGSGFHPEFTGIENIYFYGSLLGINNGFMKKKIDEIIDFSGLGDFINYPVKTYSSGMYVRLAFSVATIVEPDILIIDEALSVGDQCFQKKCLDKMADLKKRNKTVVFCTHDTYQIKAFCDKAMWLDHGKIRMLGNTSDVVNAYVGYEQTKAETHETEIKKEPQSSFLFIKDFSIKQDQENNLDIEFKVTSLEPFEGHVGWAILRNDRLQISFMTTKMQGKRNFLFDQKEKSFKIRIENLNIVSGNYIVYAGVFDKEAYRPLVIESQKIFIHTDVDILNSICFLQSSIRMID